MSDMPCHITDGPRHDDGDGGYIGHCDIHGDYGYSVIEQCPDCARRETLRKAAIGGLDLQLQRITNHNIFDKQDMVHDLKRALNFMRDYK